MRSEFFERFGIRNVECEVEVRKDPHGLSRLWFRSEGNPLVGLDLTGASQLRQLMEAAGDVERCSALYGE